MDATLSLWGENIRRRREAMDLSQDDLATRVGVRQPTIWRWEKGVMEPKRDNKVALARVLDVDVYLLFPVVSEGVAS